MLSQGVATSSLVPDWYVYCMLRYRIVRQSSVLPSRGVVQYSVLNVINIVLHMGTASVNGVPGFMTMNVKVD